MDIQQHWITHIQTEGNFFVLLDHPLVQRSTSPKVHYSEGLLVRKLEFTSLIQQIYLILGSRSIYAPSDLIIWAFNVIFKTEYTSSGSEVIGASF
jgi:hypothetical protein